MYLRGKGVPVDFDETMRLYRKAADQGYAIAEVQIGVWYEHSEPQNFAEALKWYRKAADQGNASGQFNLGSLYAEGHGVPQDYVSAYMWLNLAEAQEGPNAYFGGLRDKVALFMTPAQIAEAQKLAREWKPTKQQSQ
jgi:TPR repeat protein